MYMYIYVGEEERQVSVPLRAVWLVSRAVDKYI
jgi:hypothetical protein